MSTDSKSIVLITGANRGIGYTLAQTLARDHGFHVLLGSRTLESGELAIEKLRSRGLSVDSIAIDLVSDASITEAVNTVKQKYGKLDVLVNNAGVLFDNEWTGEKRQLWQETFNTNVFGTGIVTEAFAPLLAKSLLPRIVFLSSFLGSISDRLNANSIYDRVDSDVYRCSKAAVDMIGAIYARKYEKWGWKVNVACPGYVITGINKGGGVLTTEECMPNLVRLCTLKDGGETGTFTDANGAVPW